MKYLVLIISIFFFSSFLPGPVSAHILKTDNDIGVVLHIDPDDDPIAKASSKIFAEFKDKRGKLNLKECDCIMTISEGPKLLYKDPFFHEGETNLTGPHLSIIFPQKDLYTITMEGKPKSEGLFQSFKFTFDIRVEREAPFKAQKSSSPSWEKMIGAGIVLLVLIVAIAKLKKK